MTARLSGINPQMRLFPFAAFVVILGSWPRITVAQRQPVLQQIKVPHNYYYREMYLPQVTSGPSSVTWSPDGRELIYSMQGSLWRQRIGSSSIRQLTAGPGYDYQPDWSPDGHSLVYASYRDDAIGLRLIDLRTGDDRLLVEDGSVNVEPRWSPDGRRLAYVSTAYQGRWHIYVASVDSSGRLGSPQRITEDRDSHLPRYYYGVYDQYLSPTWSPDGSELIFVSNRGHIWGSGGFWRMAAHPGGAPRELHYEETTWRARPDWSRDGKRVVYSSYLGRQWNQLWLMTADGGDPFQLTYGAGDATAPRWSPDGTRIAFISNEAGNTELRIVDVPGGAIERVKISQRIYLNPVAHLDIRVIDTRGRSMPARVSVVVPDGRSFGPDNAWLHADDGFDRRQRRFEYGYFHTAGMSAVTVPPGQVAIEISHGPEYQVFRKTLTVGTGSTIPVRAVLARVMDLPAAGWFSGDLHVHMNYGGAYRNTPARLAGQARAEDLHLVENLIVNKEGRIPDIEYFNGAPDRVSTSATLIAHDQEYHTSYWGHVGLLGLTQNIVLPGYAGYANTAAASIAPDNAAIMDLAHAQGGVTGYVHPIDSYPDPSDTSKALTNELPVDVALGKVDYYEALGFVDSYEATAKVWYQLLNCGFKLPAGAGTDAMANFASLRGPVGMNRVYVRSGRPLSQRRFLDSLKAGRSFATNGPLLGFTLNGKELGQELSLPAGKHELLARVRLRSIVPVSRLEIIRNGQVIAAVPLRGDRTRASTTMRFSTDESGWYLLRARGEGTTYPVLDVYPYATTGAIYVTIGGRPIRSSSDADFFLAWIDRLARAAQEHSAWNTEQEKATVLDDIRRARAEFQRRRGS